MSNKGFWLASRRSQRSCEERSDEALENEERSDEHLNKSNQIHRAETNTQSRDERTSLKNR
jgi:hypothetical protein